MSFVLMQSAALDAYLIPANELEIFRGWARMAMLMKSHLGLSYLGIILDLSAIASW